MPRKRAKDYTRSPMGEHMFTDPHKEAQYTRDLVTQGYSREHAQQQAKHWSQIHHERVSQALPAGVAEATDIEGETPLSYAPTPSINPQNPRTVAAEYYPLSQRMLVRWGDGGTPYFYYNVTPQEWDSFQKADSPGRWINAIGNAHEYGPI